MKTTSLRRAMPRVELTQASVASGPSKSRLDPPSEISSGAALLAQASRPNMAAARARVKGGRWPAELLALAPPEPMTAAQITRAVELNHRGSLLRAARLLTSPTGDLHLGPVARSLLGSDPSFAAVMTGLHPYAILKLPPDVDPTSDDAIRASIELSTLVRRFALATGERVSLSKGETAGAFTFIHEGAGQAIAEAAGGAEKLAYRSRDLDRAISDAIAGKNRPLKEVFDAHVARTRKDAEALQSSLLEASAIPPRVHTDRSLKQIGLICFASDAQQVRDFADAIRIWDQNLDRFGHTGVTLRLCDDSSEPYSGQIERFIRHFKPRSGMKLVYLGSKEKESLREQMLTRILAGNTAKAMIAKGEIAVDDVAAAVQVMFGSPEHSGPTQNRNLSMALFGGKPGVQLDHDQTPEVLTFGVGDFALNSHLTDYEDVRRLYSRSEEDERERPVPIPVDLLGHFEKHGGHALVSPWFSGGNDAVISEIVRRTPEASAASAGHQDERFLLRRRDLNSRQINAYFEFDPSERTNAQQTRAPMFVPAKRGPNNEYVPFVVPVRDGDLYLGMMMEKAGVPRESSRICIFHREEAGAKWGSKAKLLFDTMLSSATWDGLSVFLGSGAKTDSPLDTRTLAEHVLAGLADEKTREAVRSSLRSAIKDALGTAQAALTAELSLEKDLATLRLRISNPTAPRDQLEGLALWLFRDEVTKNEGHTNADGKYVYGPRMELDDACARVDSMLGEGAARKKAVAMHQKAIDRALDTCRGASRSLRTTFGVEEERSDAGTRNWERDHEKGEAAMRALIQKIDPTVETYLRSYALAILFRGEILI